MIRRFVVVIKYFLGWFRMCDKLFWSRGRCGVGGFVVFLFRAYGFLLRRACFVCGVRRLRSDLSRRVVFEGFRFFGFMRACACIRLVYVRLFFGIEGLFLSVRG